jgi:hypothetical protein
MDYYDGGKLGPPGPPWFVPHIFSILHSVLAIIALFLILGLYLGWFAPAPSEGMYGKKFRSRSETMYNKSKLYRPTY